MADNLMEDSQLGEARFRSLAENSPDLIIRYDLNGRRIYVNPAWQRLSSIPVSDALGSTPSELSSLRDPDGYQASLLAAARGEPSEVEVITDSKIYGRRVHHIVLIPELGPDGAVESVLAIGRDLTVRKEAEERAQDLNAQLEERVRLRTKQLDEANRELEAFNFSVSHDLRSPIRTIKGFIDLVLEDNAESLDAESQLYLRKALAACDRMQDLIAALLQFSKVSRGEILRVSTDLSEMVSLIAGNLTNSNPERKVDFSIAAGCVIQAQPDLLQIAVENMLSNAWKFTVRAEKAKIEFGVLTDGPIPTYFVRDNGVGYDMSYATKLFEPFQRLHAVSDFPGTGIGLATVKRIISRHGGRVWMTGEVGVGATIFFTLNSE